MNHNNLIYLPFFPSQVPGETQGEAAPAGKKTVETVKAVSSTQGLKYIFICIFMYIYLYVTGR